MNKKDIIEWLLVQENNEKMPKYIEVEDVNRMQVKIDGNWCNSVYSWGIVFVSDKWIYFETDDDRGYISDLKRSTNEQEVCEYAKISLQIKLLACNGSSKFDMAARYIQRNYDYSESRAKKMIDNLCLNKDIFEEFFSYLCLGKFKKDGISVCDFSAEKLFNEYNLSVLGAYNYLIYLQEEQEEALIELKIGLKRR